MANGEGRIDEFISAEAIVQFDKAIEKAKELEQSLINNVNQIARFNAGMGDSKSLKNFEAMLKQLNIETAAVTKASKEYTQTMASQAVERQRLIAQMKGVSRETLETMGAYERAVATHKRLEKEAKNLGIALGVESEQFKRAAQAATVYRDTLAKVEQASGNNSRITGNYRNEMFQLSQVIRELPAFTYSASTGIMALSNNLPMLADAFIKVKNSVGDDGKKTGVIGALSMFAKGIFSLPNIFAIAVAAFTIWNREIMAFIKGTDAAADSAELLNQALGGDEAKAAQKQLIELTQLTKDVADSYVTQEKALKIYNETWAKYLGTVDTWGKAQDLILSKGDLVVELLIKQAVAQKYLTASIDENFKAREKEREGPSTLDKLMAGLRASPLILKNVFKNSAEINQLYTELLIGYHQKSIDKAKESSNTFLDEYKKVNEEINKAAKAGGVDLTGKAADGTDKSKTGAAKSKAEIDDQQKKFLAMKAADQKYWDEVEKLMLSANKSMYDKLSDLDEDEKDKALKAEKEHQKNLFKTLKDGQELIIIQQEIKEENRLRRLRKANDIRNKSLEYTNELLGIADGLAQRELQAIDVKERRLKDLYDNELRFINQSGLSTKEKEKEKQRLEAETAQKQKAIDREKRKIIRDQAKLQKAADIGSIISYTAIAVMAQLGAKPSGWQAFVRAALVGAAGLLQLGKVIATPLPGYRKGRKGGKAEFANVSEAGQEAMRTKDGKMTLLPETESTVFIPEGADIITHEELKKHNVLKKVFMGGKSESNSNARLASLFEDNNKKLDKLTRIIEAKDYSPSISVMDKFNHLIQQRVR
jgi:hypothetical protein